MKLWCIKYIFLFSGKEKYIPAFCGCGTPNLTKP